MTDVTFQCKSCNDIVLVSDDWEICTQVCEYCGAEHSVELSITVKSVELYEE